jgi:hypothetical protein
MRKVWIFAWILLVFAFAPNDSYVNLRGKHYFLGIPQTSFRLNIDNLEMQVIADGLLVDISCAVVAMVCLWCVIRCHKNWRKGQGTEENGTQ